MKKKNYGIQEDRDKDGSLMSRFKTVTSKKEAKSSVGLILTGFIEPDKEYLVQELGREDKYLMITKVKPPQIPERFESLDTIKENKKDANKDSTKNVKVTTSQTTPQRVLKPIDLGENEKETVGFNAPPNLFINLINLIALPLNEQCEFGKIVLHFDSKREELWWSNKAPGGSFLVNFGHATYDYFSYCWGDGEIAIDAIKLINYLRKITKAEQVIFIVDPKKGRYKINLDGKIELSDGKLEEISEIRTHKPRIDYVKNQNENKITLDDNYIPKLKEEIAHLKYGGIIGASALKRIVQTGTKYHIKTYPIDFKINPPALIVTLNDKFSPQLGTQTMELTIKEGSLIPPDVDISLLISDKLEAPAMVLKGNIILRLAKGYKTPIYLLKVEKSKVNPNGVMFAGMLIASKGKEPIVPQDKPGIEIST